MRVPIRKPGQHTFDQKDPHITAGKFLELKENLEKLKKFVRPRLSREVQEQAAFGDFSENAAYSIAKGRLRGVNQRIIELEDQIKKAIIIEPKKKGGAIDLGSKVVVLAKGKQREYRILGSSEANPDRGIISHNSPLGSALMGRREGEKVQVQLSDKAVEYEIIGVE